MAGERRVGIALDRDESEVAVADLGLEAAHERLVGERDVEVRADGRHADGVAEPSERLVERAEQLGGAEAPQANDGREAVLERARRVLELAEEPVPLDSRVRAA